MLQPSQAKDSHPPLDVARQSGAAGRGAYMAEKRNSERVMRSKMDAAIRSAIHLSTGNTVHGKHRFMEVVPAGFVKTIIIMKRIHPVRLALL
jgi:hypothetical protein